MTRQGVLLATRNQGKLRELRPMLEAAGYLPFDLDTAGISELPEESTVESHDTFAANALAKARYFAARYPHVAVLADDSGLVVDVLGGSPGVQSRRWALLSGEYDGALDSDAANNARLVRELARAGGDDHKAQFVCAAAWVEGERELVGVGKVVGQILLEPRGSHGFGYDPHFLSTELGKGFGEASLEEKARVSHRARAVAAVLAQLKG